MVMLIRVDTEYDLQNQPDCRHTSSRIHTTGKHHDHGQKPDTANNNRYDTVVYMGNQRKEQAYGHSEHLKIAKLRGMR
jgi:hypothetical protein